MDALTQPIGAPSGDLAAGTVGIEPVPASHRILGFRGHAVLWADLGVGLLVLLAGTSLVPALGFGEALVAIVVGTVAGTAMLGLAGLVGSRYAVPSMVSLRPSFGRRGSYLPSLLNLVQLVGWGAFELIVMAHASASLLGGRIGPAVYPAAVLVWATVAILMGLGGPLVVVRQWLEKVGLPLVILTGAWIAIYAATHADLGALVARPGSGGLTFAQAIDLVVAMPVSWLPLVADFNRFARDDRSSFWGTVVGFGIANVACYSLGALLILALPSQDLVGSILAVAFGAWGLVMLLADETDNAFADVYSGAISVKNVLPTIPTRALIVALGAVCAVLALLVDLTQYSSFLYLIGSIFSPLFGVLFADYFLVRRRRYAHDEFYPTGSAGGGPGTVAGVSVIALAAWACGVAVYVWQSVAASWLGGTIPSIVTTLVVYLVLATVVGRGREGRASRG